MRVVYGYYYRRGHKPMMRGGRLLPLLALVAGFLLPGRAGALLVEGDEYLNFAYGSFHLSSGTEVTETITGLNPYRVTRSATAWVVVSDLPQLCMAVHKVAQDPDTGEIITQAFSGQRVCFTITYSNCGTALPHSYELIDRTPANVVISNEMGFYPMPGNFDWRYPGEPTFTDEPLEDVEGPIEMRWSAFYTGTEGFTPGRSGYIYYCVTVL